MKLISTKESSLLISVMDIHKMSAARSEQVSTNFPGDNLLSKSEHQRTCSADSFLALLRSGIAYCAINKWKSTYFITRSRQSGERWSRAAIAACSHFHFSPVRRSAGPNEEFQLRNGANLFNLFSINWNIEKFASFSHSACSKRRTDWARERKAGKMRLKTKWNSTWACCAMHATWIVEFT